MPTDAGAVTAITNLLYTYAERMDAGDFAGAAELFRHATIRLTGDSVVDADAILAIWESSVRRYADGTPRTKHVTTNVIVDIDPTGNTARTRSYYTVFQQTDTLALQPIIAGRYHDRFEKAASGWRFSDRMIFVDLVGDLRRHLKMRLPGS